MKFWLPAAAVAAAASCAAAGSPERISINADGHFVDPEGRVRLFHGMNAVQKASPWIPSVLQNATRVADMQRFGFNAVRVGTMWSGVVPEARGEYNDSYVDVMAGIVDSLAAAGMHSILDMHQDVGSSLWGSYDGIPLWLASQSAPAHAYPWPVPEAVIHKAWGAGYLAQATGVGFQDLYENTYGGADALGEFWAHVAGRFADTEAVLAYELINEPWAGDVYGSPAVLLPGEAGAQNLMPLYDSVAAAIRAVDNSTVVMYEPVTWGMIFDGALTGSGLDHVPGGADYADRSALSWHYYCWFMGGEADPYPLLRREACDKAMGPQVFGNVPDLVGATGGGNFLTEFGLCSPSNSSSASGTVECEAVLREANAGWVSWTFWDAAFWDEATGAVREDYAAPFVQAYPRAVQGAPVAGSLEWDFAARTLSFAFTLDASVGAPTEVFVPAAFFGADDYSVEVTAGAGMEVQKDGDVATIVAGEAAEDGQEVAVTVSL